MPKSAILWLLLWIGGISVAHSCAKRRMPIKGKEMFSLTFMVDLGISLPPSLKPARMAGFQEGENMDVFLHSKKCSHTFTLKKFFF